VSECVCALVFVSLLCVCVALVCVCVCGVSFFFFVSFFAFVSQVCFCLHCVRVVSLADARASAVFFPLSCLCHLSVCTLFLHAFACNVCMLVSACVCVCGYACLLVCLRVCLCLLVRVERAVSLFPCYLRWR
jgi:hypothetical protein